MARLDEIGEGVATVLAAAQSPEPLYLELTNHSPVDATILVRSVIEACHRKAAPIALVRLGHEMGSRLCASLGSEKTYEGVEIQLIAGADRRVEFFRFPPSPDRFK